MGWRYQALVHDLFWRKIVGRAMRVAMPEERALARRSVVEHCGSTLAVSSTAPSTGGRFGRRR